MVGRMSGSGFLGGAIGGLVIALLLVGVVSLAPQSSNPFAVSSAPGKGTQAASLATTTTTSVAAPAVPSSSSAVYAAATTTTTTVVSTATIASSTTQAGGQNAAASAPVAGGAAGAATTTTATVTMTTTTTTAAASSSSSSSELRQDQNKPVPAQTTDQHGAPSTSPQQQQRPGSLLTSIPGESVSGLIATLSPLLIGLLVAVLIYGAYSRRQDSS